MGAGRARGTVGGGVDRAVILLAQQLAERMHLDGGSAARRAERSPSADITAGR